MTGKHLAQSQGVGLCHGVSGNGYALLSAYHYTGDKRYLRRAAQFGSFMADHWQELLNVPDRPLSLYEVGLVTISVHTFTPVSLHKLSPASSATLS